MGQNLVRIVLKVKSLLKRNQLFNVFMLGLEKDEGKGSNLILILLGLLCPLIFMDNLLDNRYPNLYRLKCNPLPTHTTKSDLHEPFLQCAPSIA